MAWPKEMTEPIKCVYISFTDIYKHQWNVVKAIKILRDKGFNIALELVGGGHGKAKVWLKNEITKSDPNNEFVLQREYVPQNEIAGILSRTHIFLFASSCENMPITLLQGMAAGLHIACSDRGPMPEILQDGGLYFDPENPKQIASNIEDLINNKVKREATAIRANQISKQYTWERCSSETFSYIIEIANKENKIEFSNTK